MLSDATACVATVVAVCAVAMRSSQKKQRLMAAVASVAAASACVGILVGCTPRVPAAASHKLEPAEEASQSHATRVRRTLEQLPAEGQVVIYSHGVKWRTLAAAQQGAAVTRAGLPMVHEVVADHGDIIEVSPALTKPYLDCYPVEYRSQGDFALNGFVRKVDVELVLAQELRVEHDDGSRYLVRAGARVTHDDGYHAVIGGFSLPLPADVLVALSYSPMQDSVERRSARARRRHAQLRGRRKRVDGRLELAPDARMRIGGVRFTLESIAKFKPSHEELSRVRDNPLQYPRTIERQAAGALVTLTSKCLELRARVAGKDIVEPEPAGGGGGVVGGLGGFGVGGGSISRRPPKPPPKEHYMAEGTALQWKGGRTTVGVLQRAIVSYAAKSPVCMVAAQGFVDATKVCVQAEKVVRDCRKACRENGLCDVDGSDTRCIASKAEHCLESQQCKGHGACGLLAGACVVENDQHCRESSDCEESPNACMAYEGKCVVTPNPDCANRPACKNKGRCVANEVGACIAGDAKDCTASAACKQEGKCGYVVKYHNEGMCAPRGNADCRGSEVCAESGLCSRKGQACVVGSTFGCRNSRVCRSDGKCTMLTRNDGGIGTGLGGAWGGSKTNYCGPGSAADCSQSTRCKTQHYCRLEDGFGMKSCGYESNSVD